MKIDINSTDAYPADKPGNPRCECARLFEILNTLKSALAARAFLRECRPALNSQYIAA